MKSPNELEEYIKAQTVAYAAAEEDFVYDVISLDTFREVLRFAIGEGFQADPKAIDRVLNGEPDYYDNEDDNYTEEDTYTDWYFMGVVCEAMDEQIRQKTMPEKAEKIYKFYCFTMCGFEADFWDL